MAVYGPSRRDTSLCNGEIVRKFRFVTRQVFARLLGNVPTKFYCFNLTDFSEGNIDSIVVCMFAHQKILLDLVIHTPGKPEQYCHLLTCILCSAIDTTKR